VHQKFAGNMDFVSIKLVRTNYPIDQKRKARFLDANVRVCYTGQTARTAGQASCETEPIRHNAMGGDARRY